MTESRDNTEKVAREIGRLGFVRWHERTLIRAHMHLVTCILGFVLVVVGFEMFSDPASLWDWFRRYGLMFAGAMLTVFGWTHYRIDMTRAQSRADRAKCPQCGVYGAFDVHEHGLSPADDAEQGDDDAGGWIRVVCRRCGERWNI